MRDVALGIKQKNGDFTGAECDIRFHVIDKTCILVEWGVGCVGFGQLYLNLNGTGELTNMSAETMQKPFIKALLAAAVDNAELTD